MDYTAYTDESYINGERYRSICSFSFVTGAAEDINCNLLEILKESSVKEFKWQKVKDAKYRFCANKLVNFTINSIHKYDIRIDVVIWDTFDSRHSISSRDDNANFERMFFHILSNSMKRRMPKSNWSIYPDKRMGIDWKKVHNCLKSVGRWQEYTPSPLFGDFFKEPYYNIDKFREIDSLYFPCCHVSDLFAGISVYSKNNFDKYSQWKANQLPSLFKQEIPQLTNREEFRFEVMDNLNIQCKKRKLGVSLERRKCFSTPNPINPINFWYYKPQHEMDNAPTKK
ncbi:MAG: hypothetical protein K8F52_08055 [Candidatus Scalindua rubra]|uniref:DUF3800 domain-containing protein n=1 Tax=Candidatus Scalindua brodae TaxID=237368 RepID=A0A0B0EKZ7_9BACT|nr:MAG: hypothetical protein SCABRO_02494 [Candidatus Scalindua brodae]MBZ0108610.1 hypothetical protein [Candidatus Scalindua rubra]TWU38178.1 hypothetical protein S225a_02250 [Candidatus Brocadiaceae bacterium S225]